MARREQKTTGYVIIGGLAALLLWLLSKSTPLLHESVSAGIVTAQGTVTPDQYGNPQFDTTIPASVPKNQGNAVPPVDYSGALNWNPSDPTKVSCPIGSTLWHNVTDGTYQCIPN